ncbi:hypothetical protein HN873_047396, partial [Arachis hypogaea]
VVLMDDKINSVVRVLSGGMKRKLSLGIALIGNNKVRNGSILNAFDFIGRIILLATHSMDESYELDDRIAIMANGFLKCRGRFNLLLTFSNYTVHLKASD